MRSKQEKLGWEKQKKEGKKREEKEKEKKRKKTKESKVIDVKRVAKEWEIWDDDEKVARSMEEVKKLVPE